MNSFEHKPIIPPPISPTKTKEVDIKVSNEDQYDTVTESAYGLIEQDTLVSKWLALRPKGSLPRQRSNHSVIIYKDILYLFGGNELKSETYSDIWAINLSSVEEQMNGKSTKDIEWYQIPTTGDKPGKVSHHGAALYKNEMIIYGGLHNYINTDKSLYSLNLDNLEWKVKVQKGTKPLPRDEHTVIIWNTSMLVFGGSLSKGSISNDLWSYSLETEEWKKMEITGSKPCPRSGHAACVINSKMYMFGGISEENVRLNDLWVCNLETPQWEEIKVEKPPKGRSYHSLVSSEGKIYMFGGLSSITQELNDLWQFDPTAIKWTLLFACSLNPRAYYSYQLAAMKKDVQKKCDSPSVKDSPIKDASFKKEGTKKEADARMNLITPMTQRMINSPLIEHSDKSFDIYYQQLKKKKKAMQGLGAPQIDQSQLVKGYYPCVRSSHRVAIFRDYFVVMGGDKNQMALNDTFFFSLK